jgi:CHAT domain-containing protein/tetratricopeptide (TPR) repeat protein
MLRGADARQAAALQGQAVTLWARGELEGAEAVARRLLALRQRRQGARHWETVDARVLAGALAQGARAGEEEREAFAALPALRQRAAALQEQGKGAAAAALLEKARAACRKALGEEHPYSAFLCGDLAGILTGQGKHALAEPLYRQALRSYRKSLGERHPTTAAGFNNLAACLNARGKYREAQPLYEKALAICRTALGEQHPSTAQSYNNVAFNLNALGQYARAHPLFEKALAIQRKVLGEEHPDTALASSNLAGNLDSQARSAQAQPLHEKALAIWRTVLGDEHPRTAGGFNNLAGNLNAQGKYVLAQPLFEKALAIYRRLLGEEHPETALAYNNLAYNLNGQGKHVQAQPIFEKALAISRTVLGEKHPNTAVCYNNVGHNLNRQRKHAQAQPFYEKALAIYRQALGEEHPDTGRAYHNLASNLYSAGKYAKAQPLYEKALAIQRKVSGEEHPLTAHCYSGLANNLKEQGKYAQAQPLYEKALAIHKKVLGEEHPETAHSFHNVANNLHRQRKYRAAQKMAQRAVRSFGGARSHVGFSGQERTAFTSRQSPLDLLAVLRARGGEAALAWEALEGGLSPGLLDDLALRGRSLSAQERRRLSELESQRGQLDRQLPALLAAQTDQARKAAEQLRQQRQETQRRLNEQYAALARKYGPAAGHVSPRSTIQKSLARDEALLAWLDGPDEHWACLLRRKGEPLWLRLRGSGARGAWTAADHQLPAILRAQLTSPPENNSWRTAARKLYAQRLAPLSKHLGATKDLPTVRKLIVLPGVALAGIPVECLLAARPEGAADYVVSYAPSGTLYAYLQQQRARARPEKAPRLLALGDPAFRPLEKPGEQPEPPDHGVLLSLVQRSGTAARAGLKAGDVLLRYAGSKVRDLPALLAALKKHAGDKPGKEPSLEIAYWRAGKRRTARMFPGPLGISVDRRAARVAVRAEREAQRLLARTRQGFVPLPGTRREVQALARLFGRGEVLLDESASEARLETLARQQKLKQYRYLHFATHGQADPEHPLRSFLALADRGLPDPLGQVLAGKPAYVGRLMAEQILANWHLDAELVVLSACQSGLGKYEAGEGYVGFAQALFLAGARSLVLSQWSVDDEATALLMVRFYQNVLGKRKGLKKPMGKAEALREAKRWLRGLSAKEAKGAVASLPRGKVVPRKPAVRGSKPYAHPYSWAGFILIGDPR